MTFSTGFEYEVAPEAEAEFEAVYGPDGTWTRFFREDVEYVETTLERLAEGVYLVTDRWTSQAAYERFLERNAARYEALSRACERLYVSERRLPPT